jgi:hypothetical protein
MAVCVVADTLDDHTGNCIPYSGSLHFKPDNPRFLADSIAMNSRFDDAVPGRNRPDMNSRGVPLVPSGALDQLCVVAFELSAGRLDSPLADGIREIGTVCACAADFRAMMLVAIIGREQFVVHFTRIQDRVIDLGEMLGNLFLKPSSMDLSF